MLNYNLVIIPDIRKCNLDREGAYFKKLVLLHRKFLLFVNTFAHFGEI